MLFFYGIRTTHLKTIRLNESQIQCQHCQSGNMFLSIFGRYAHLFWIPLFPIGKTGTTQCEHCKQVLRKRESTPRLNQEYKLLKNQSKITFWHFVGLIIIGPLFILPMFISVIARFLT